MACKGCIAWCAGRLVSELVCLSVCLSVRMSGDRLSVPKDKLLHTYTHTFSTDTVT